MEVAQFKRRQLTDIRNVVVLVSVREYFLHHEEQCQDSSNRNCSIPSCIVGIVGISAEILRIDERVGT